MASSISLAQAKAIDGFVDDEEMTLLKLILHCLKALMEGQPSKLMLSASFVLGQSAAGPVVAERKEGSTLVSALCPRARAPPPSNGKVEDDITEGCPTALPLVPSRAVLLGQTRRNEAEEEPPKSFAEIQQEQHC